MRSFLIFIVLFNVALFSSYGSSGNSSKADVKEIIDRANHMALYQGIDCKGRLNLEITDSNGLKRKRVVNILRMNCDGKDGAQKYYAYFREPSDVRRMVFMVHKYGSIGKEDDRWLYMPGLDLVKRIAAGDKRTSFAGSDFLYEDISGRHPLEDRHEILEVRDEVYIIKNTPLKPEKVEFEYYLATVDRQSFITRKIEYFKRGGRLARTITVEEVEEIAGFVKGKRVKYPTVVHSSAVNHETGSRTEMRFSRVKYNVGVKEKYFTERYLRRPPGEVIR